MYVEQGYKGEIGIWKYFLIPLGFIGLMVLNYLAIVLLDLDIEAIMEAEINRKGANRFLIEMLIPFIVGLALLFLWVKFIHKQTLTSLTTSRQKIDWKRVFFAFALWSTITIVITGIDIVVAPEDYILNFRWEPFLYLLIIAILLIPIQTSFEEYLFRGYMMQGIGIMAKNRWVPLFVTSVLFGLMHLGNPEVGKLGYGIMVYYIGTGFFLGIMTLMDEGLELALGFHASNNLVTALLITADSTAFQVDAIYKNVAEPDLGFDAFLPVFVVFPILLYVFSKKYQWKNWKQRLAGPVLSREEFFTSNNDETQV
ncbi:CPBP family intramembrane glutamic endopeptidase [Ulvibacterium marinum]|uniref:CPBP family intramembrane metalloprotease n=1 Tax=Ulvibacterium marinum TaxID=2419782 RepID=A0A3B0C9Z7_9FLAO|nr:type II CAAX endopeptidase family protein [Ulvibacterium marinum]RKN81448.1 CPBP family intramembrane metalloprotease [Ulvibacterium marinum]